MLKGSDGDIWFAEARDWNNDDPHAVLKIGVDKRQIFAAANRGQSWVIGELYGVLATGLISAQHVFQGAKRRMLVNGNGDADQSTYFFTWRANRDAQAVDKPTGLELVFYDAPVSAVFCVMVLANHDPAHPEIFGWARNWSWLDADPLKIGAPEGWEDKYDRRIAYEGVG